MLTFWHNVQMQSSGYVNYCVDIYWSLSVEEVLYLVLPLVCLMLRRTWLIVLFCVATLVSIFHFDVDANRLAGGTICFRTSQCSNSSVVLCANAILKSMVNFINQQQSSEHTYAE